MIGESVSGNLPGAMFSEQEQIFLDRLHTAVPGMSEAALRLFWDAFKTEAIHRLAVERKPLDLGFIEIHPVPYRKNWKELLLSKARDLLLRIRAVTLGEHPEQVYSMLRWLHGMMNNTEMLSIREGFICWSFECLPSDRLELEIEGREYALKEKLNPYQYSDKFVHQLPAYLPSVMEIVRSYSTRIFLQTPLYIGGVLFEASQENKDRYSAITPSLVRWNGNAPSIYFQRGKKKRSPASSNHSQLSETVPDPPPAAQPGGTGAAPG